MINKVTLIGNLGRDPEVIDTKSGSKLAKFSLATTDRVKKDGEWVNQTEWHSITVFGKTCEFIERNLKKGSKVAVLGKITYNKWEDKDGNKHNRTDIIANEIHLLDPREKKANDDYSDDEPSGDSQLNDDLPF